MRAFEPEGEVYAVETPGAEVTGTSGTSTSPLGAPDPADYLRTRAHVGRLSRHEQGAQLWSQLRSRNRADQCVGCNRSAVLGGVHAGTGSSVLT